MSESRIDIIVAGAVVLDECMRILGANELVFNARGIREGIVIDTVERERGSAVPQDRMQTVRDFGRKCHADVPHAEQVRVLAVTLFDELAPRLELDPATRPLIEAAALLHDVGYHIAYERHHKHSYHLISYADLPGFSPKELRAIAAIPRYHRGSLPKARQEALHDLARQEREVVSRLAAILRLADGLDRSRGQRVDSLCIESQSSRLVLNLSGEASLAVEVHGAQRKADLFESVFNMRVDVVDATNR
jgi:exopolyphosphatase/guanosine-5'-triphosphate,3'-diphosphate pyrophosphatase